MSCKERLYKRELLMECVAKLKNVKAARAGEIVVEFIQYEGDGMLNRMMIVSNDWIWEHETFTSKRCREGRIVCFVKKRNKQGQPRMFFL